MWKEGTLQVGNSEFKYWVKVFDEGSEFGIDGGRISKLMLKRNGIAVCCYDRGWDIKPVDSETQTAYNSVLQKWN